MLAAALLLSAALLLLSRADDNVLHIGGIFPIGGKGGWQGGQACEPAVRLALDDVNKNSVLSGYQLNLHWNDSEVTAAIARLHPYSALGLRGFHSPGLGWIFHHISNGRESDLSISTRSNPKPSRLAYE